MQYVHIAEKYMEKSTARDFKHGAVCIKGGKVISGGCNAISIPHMIRFGSKVC